MYIWIDFSKRRWHDFTLKKYFYFLCEKNAVLVYFEWFTCISTLEIKRDTKEKNQLYVTVFGWITLYGNALTYYYLYEVGH